MTATMTATSTTAITATSATAITATSTTAMTAMTATSTTAVTATSITAITATSPRRSWSSRLVLAVLGAALALGAASRPAIAAPWVLTVSPTGKITQSDGGLVDAKSGRANAMSGPQELHIRCARFDCRRVAAAAITDDGATAALAPTRDTRAERRFLLQPMTATLSVELTNPDGTYTPVLTASLAAGSTGGTVGASGASSTGGAGGTGGAAAAALTEVSIRELLATRCPRPATPDPVYDRAASRAAIVVSATGMPLTTVPGELDENDSVQVTVRADARLLPLLRVTRKSPFRDLAGVAILGEQVAIPRELQERIARQAAEDPECGEITVVLRDFAPGRAVVQLQALAGDTAIALGELELGVRPVYSGMFSLGAAWTRLVDPRYTVAQRDGQPVIAARESGARRLEYVLLYTPFLWDRLERDVRKRPLRWYHHVHPTVGVSLSDPLDHVLAGISADAYGAIAVTGGRIVSRIQQLDGAAVGDRFDGDAAALPITHRWKSDWFLALTIDVRAATSLVRAVLGSAAPSGG